MNLKRDEIVKSITLEAPVFGAIQLDGLSRINMIYANDPIHVPSLLSSLVDVLPRVASIDYRESVSPYSIWDGWRNIDRNQKDMILKWLKVYDRYLLDVDAWSLGIKVRVCRRFWEGHCQDSDWVPLSSYDPGIYRLLYLLVQMMSRANQSVVIPFPEVYVPIGQQPAFWQAIIQSARLRDAQVFALVASEHPVELALRLMHEPHTEDVGLGELIGDFRYITITRQGRLCGYKTQTFDWDTLTTFDSLWRLYERPTQFEGEPHE